MYRIEKISNEKYLFEYTKGVNLLTAFTDVSGVIQFKDLNLCFLNNPWKALAWDYNEYLGILEWWTGHQVNMSKPVVTKELSLLQYKRQV